MRGFSSDKCLSTPLAIRYQPRTSHCNCCALISFSLFSGLEGPLILRASAEPCGIQLLPYESRLASAGPLAYLQDSGAAQSIRDVRVPFRSNSGDGRISARCGGEVVFCLPLFSLQQSPQ